MVVSLLPITAQAAGDQVLVTVGDGTETNGYVPIYGQYIDAYEKAQYVIPATSLTALNGRDITALTWYLSSTASGWWGNANFEIRLSEIENTSLNAFVDVSGAAVAYSGSLDGRQSEMNVAFTTPYAYKGGNLLVSVFNTEKGNYQKASFYGTTVEGASVQGESYASLDSISPTQRNFLPKTTLISAAPVTAYDLYIAGTQVNEDNASDVLGDSTVSYDPDTNTLTLNNANITGGSENTNNYGWGICYRGADDFNIVANGTNTVSDDSYRTYASYGIMIGEPDPRALSTNAVDVTITVSDGASLTVSGGNVNQSESFSGSWGIYNKGSGSLNINGSGNLTVSAKDNHKKSIGILAQDVTFDGSCSVTATAGDSGDSMSVGIYCGNFTVPQSFIGSVIAESGDALGANYNSATYGIRTTADCTISGGNVTASTGSRTGSNTGSDYAVGIFGENSLTISGGATVNATGDGHGLWCYQRITSIDASSVTAIGGNYAVNDLTMTNVTAVGSTLQNGSNPVEYVSSANNKYKYVKTTPSTAVSSYLITFDANGGSGTMNDMTVTEGEKLTLPGCTFTAPTKNQEFYKWDAGDPGAQIDVTGDMTVKALWKNKTVTPITPATPVTPAAPAASTERAITNMVSDTDPAGAVFGKLALKSPKQSKTSIDLSWNRVPNVNRYVIYGNKCGKGIKPVKIATVSSSNLTVSKINNINLKKGTYYKFIMVAFDKNNNAISTSKVIHVATKGGKVGNHKKVTISKSVIKKAKKLKKGKSLKLKAKAVPQAKKLKVKKHVAVRYESTDNNVATVTNKGVVKAINKGTCYIYAYAQNGIFKTIKVVVK